MGEILLRVGPGFSLKTRSPISRVPVYKYWFNNEQGNAVNLQKQEKNYNISKKL